jgi:hypothetical protein
MIAAACALLAIGCFAYVFAPVRELEHGTEKTRLVYLRERKEVIYENLRDLNFEYKAGKFPQADYEQMRSAMETEAAGVLAEIEALERLAD